MTIWKLRYLGKVSFLRRSVKFIFSLWYKNERKVKIKRGPLKGCYWICHKQHQFWMPLGVYETETANWLKFHMKEDTVFFDLGANAGYFTLLGGRQVGSGSVIAFEPVPSNVSVIEANIRANNLTNCVVEGVAISDFGGEAQFSLERNNANSHLSELQVSHMRSSCAEKIDVKTMTLDAFVSQAHVKPDLIKIDVEGAEMKVLRGAEGILREYKPTCLISTHSSDLFHACLNFMLALDYKVECLNNFEHELCCYPND
jgi:FkbM family methyltransferase